MFGERGCIQQDVEMPNQLTVATAGIHLSPMGVTLATCLTFLGIEVDTSLCQLRLSVKKLTKLKIELVHCVFCKSIVKQELQSLTGLLHLSFDNIVVDDNKCPRVISLLLK